MFFSDVVACVNTKRRAVATACAVARIDRSIDAQTKGRIAGRALLIETMEAILKAYVLRLLQMLSRRGREAKEQLERRKKDDHLGPSAETRHHVASGWRIDSEICIADSIFAILHSTLRVSQVTIGGDTTVPLLPFLFTRKCILHDSFSISPGLLASEAPYPNDWNSDTNRHLLRFHRWLYPSVRCVSTSRLRALRQM